MASLVHGVIVGYKPLVMALGNPLEAGEQCGFSPAGIGMASHCQAFGFCGLLALCLKWQEVPRISENDHAAPPLME